MIYNPFSILDKSFELILSISFLITELDAHS